MIGSSRLRREYVRGLCEETATTTKMAEDCYKTLGVRRDASQAEIQKAYRDLARKYHPDLHPDEKDAKKKFQKIQNAFDVLNDPEKREMYDRYGSSFQTRGAGGPQGAHTYTWSPGGGFGGFNPEDIDFGQFFGERFGAEPGGGLGDIFKQFTRGAGRARTKTGAGRNRGADIEHELEIPFNTAILGGDAQITVQRPGGRTETLTVKIPVGIEDGKKIRLRGQGEPAPGGGTPGDLLLTVRVAPHPHFERRGKHLYVKVPVTLAEAALGAKIDVPTPKGTVSLRIPPGTSSGTKLRVKGHGVAARDGQSGDLLAEVQIVLPKAMDESTRQALGQLNLPYGGNPRANLRW